ncbi:hypothetical protein BKA62DRAFT_684426 [Auriculariales sp. MPI-PUGE-AT-0066]|nr:hypothetical protein BKA62DRAFT_684426 [Auriculariales sp. MPI-PUGE-AT-0066]
MSSAAADGLSTAQYIAQERFRRVCPTNNVSYCDVGVPDSAHVLVLLAGSAMDCVLSGVLFEDFCRNNGLRMISVDKPGMGKTPACPIAERLASHADAIETVLTHLKVQPSVLVSISVGFLYSLNLLARKPHLFEGRVPALFSLTPWISFEDAPSLSIASWSPNWMVAAVPWFIATFAPPKLLSAFSWSSGVSTAVSSSIGFGKSEEDAERVGISNSNRDRVFHALNGAVQNKGMADEYLLCLQRGPPGLWGFKDYSEILGQIAELYPRTVLRLYMGDKDVLVPRAAQTRFIAFFDPSLSTLLPEVREKFDFAEKTFPGGGHEDVATFARCWEDISRYVHDHVSSQ